MTRPPQTERILRMLRNAGERGLTPLDVVQPSDGGSPILALSQRIGDLIQAGHEIDSQREPTASGGRVARYVLIRERSRATFSGTPPRTSCKTPPAQPEEQTLVQAPNTTAGRSA